MSAEPSLTAASGPSPAPGPDVVVVGGSAGGVAALRELVAALPADLAACVLIVLHLPRGGPASILPEILDRAGPLPVRAAAHGDVLLPGRVLVAPTNHHLLVHDGRVALSTGPAENGQRPAVDVLFRSAARELGPRVLAVVLTGNLDDGAAGLEAVAGSGGLTLVQDPDEALFAGMPRAALEAVPSARRAGLAELPHLITALVSTPREQVQAQPDDADRDRELRLARGLPVGLAEADHPGQPSAYACPDCHGVLFGVEEGASRRFRCRVGHAWSADGLAERQAQSVEAALWVALRALEERGALATEVAGSAARSGRALSEQHFRRRAEESARHADVLRRLLLEDPGPDRS